MNYCRQRETFSAGLLVYLGRCMAGGAATTAHTEKKRGGGTYWLGPSSRWEEQMKVTCSNMENHFFVTDPPGVLRPSQGLTTTGGIVWGIRGYSFVSRWHCFF